MKIALLTSGGIAPCLSASVGRLAENYLENYPEAEIIGYLNGYKGLLLGKAQTKEIKTKIFVGHTVADSPLGNSRVKLTNIQDCINKNYINKGEDPLKNSCRSISKRWSYNFTYNWGR